MATVISTSAQYGHLDETAVPGTVHLIDIDGNVRGKHASGRNTDGMYHVHSPIQRCRNWWSLVVLVPAPSNDPDDPLNWSPRRKLISTLALSTYTLVILPFSRPVYSSATWQEWKRFDVFTYQYLPTIPPDGRNCFGSNLFNFNTNSQRHRTYARWPSKQRMNSSIFLWTDYHHRMLALGTCSYSLGGGAWCGNQSRSNMGNAQCISSVFWRQW